MVRGRPGAVLNARRPPAAKGSRTGGPSAYAEESDFGREFPGASETANAAVVALVNVGERFLASFDRALRHHRLSRAGREALAVLEGAGVPLSPTTIAERLIVTTASVTSLLDTLERRGLVERRPDPSDRRKLLVVITDDGVTLVNEFLPEVMALQTAAMSTLSEPQRRQLVSLLLRVDAGLDALDADAVVRDAAPRGTPRHG